MKSALQTVSSVLGIFAGCLGIEHGFFEILQGNRATEGLLINAVGHPCQMETVWHACYPTISLIPNFLVTGIVTILVALSVMVWSTAFIQRRHGGLTLVLLSIFMLLVGGGFVSMFIGLVAGIAGSRIHAPMKAQGAGSGSRFLSKLWLWALILMGLWFPGSWILGHFFSQTMLELSGWLFIFFDICLPVLTAFLGFAADW